MPRDPAPARLLLSKAGDDLRTVELMLDHGSYPSEIVGFHAQQCCEKAIKAVLADNGVPYPFTHDLLALVDLIRDHGVAAPEILEQAPMLTPFAVVYRYEDLDLGDEPDLGQLLGIVRAVHVWASHAVAPPTG